jgi:hypothetical protein
VRRDGVPVAERAQIEAGSEGRNDRRVVVRRAAGGGSEYGCGGNQGGDDDRRDPDSEAGEVEPRCPDDVVGWGGAGFGGTWS